MYKNLITGSQYWIRQYANSPNLKRKIDNLLDDDLIWLSPIAEKSYREYELRSRYKLLGLSLEESVSFFSFWPMRQPQWDGMAVNKKNDILYLFEAKANLSEMSNKCRASGNNKALIIDSMHNVYIQQYPAGDFNAWMNKYYQIANRLTFLSRINELDSFKQIYFVIIYFVNDETHNKATSRHKFEKHNNMMFKTLIGNNNLPNNIKILYLETR